MTRTHMVIGPFLGQVFRLRASRGSRQRDPLPSTKKNKVGSRGAPFLPPQCWKTTKWDLKVAPFLPPECWKATKWDLKVAPFLPPECWKATKWDLKVPHSYLLNVGPRQEESGLHEEETLLEREQGPLVDSVVALDEADILAREEMKRHEMNKVKTKRNETKRNGTERNGT